MAKRAKKEHDFSVIAHRVVVEATRENDDVVSEPEEPQETKKPDYAALGKLGGKKGGPARAKKLTSEQRKAIAKKAAQARWRNR